jgi:ataxia telangiectasia mutated family protein
MKDQSQKTAAEKLKVFLKIRERFKPVLRHFFTETNKLPQTWYAKRLTWSRSVAACSIGGYILGLGDRHMSNLLMDAQTGEFIHIDLGIAFDQVS